MAADRGAPFPTILKLKIGKEANPRNIRTELSPEFRGAVSKNCLEQPKCSFVSECSGSPLLEGIVAR
jgi:hypothetical protein